MKKNKQNISIILIINYFCQLNIYQFMLLNYFIESSTKINRYIKNYFDYFENIYFVLLKIMF